MKKLPEVRFELIEFNNVRRDRGKSAAKISETQQRVLQLLNKGLPAQLSRGSAVEIDRKRVCNLDTMRALVRLGYAKQITSPPMWMSTEIGRQISPQTDQEKL